MTTLLPTIAATPATPPVGPLSLNDPALGAEGFADVLDGVLPTAAPETPTQAPVAPLPASPPPPPPPPPPAAPLDATAGLAALVTGMAPAWPPPGLYALFPAPAAVGPGRPAAAGVGAPPAPAAVPTGVAALPGDGLAKAPALLPAVLALPVAITDRSPERALDAPPSEAWLPPGAVAAFPSALPRVELPPNLAPAVALHSPRFADEAGARVQWLAAKGGGEATLRLVPEGLGPVEIRLSLEGDRVDLGLHAALAETRQALEQALPRLREMLAQQGLNLGHADVGSGRPQGSGDADGRRPTSMAAAADAAGEGRGDGATSSVVESRSMTAGRGLLDLYA